MKKFLTVIGIIIAILIMLLTIGGLILAKRIKQYQINSGTNVEWNSEDGQCYKNLRYGLGCRNTYDLYIPAKGRPTAIILFVHGGSWVVGEKEDIAYAARRFAKLGYITATMNYTRIKQDSIDYVSNHKLPSFVSMVDEMQQAVKAIKQECGSRGYNLTQMAIGGYSAGAHLAMLYATKYINSSPLPVKFQISWVGPADMDMLFPTDEQQLAQIKQPSTDEQNNKLRLEMVLFIHSISGRKIPLEELTVERIREIKLSFSPTYMASADTPPAILAYGANDKLVSAKQGEKMADILKQYGIDHKLFIFPNSGHELGGDADYTLQVNNAITEYCEKYFD
ncbi:MAG: alpha/beta hydrolase [Alistipes sp.]|nr:alpha/beta hydrolase [Alistipes sp.]